MLELFQMRFGGGFTSYGQPFRLRHIFTGKYLAVKALNSASGEEKGKTCVCLLDATEATRESTAFSFSTLTGTHAKWTTSSINMRSMGKPQIKFGDSEVVLIHVSTGKVLGCPVTERRHFAANGVRKAVMHSEVRKSFAQTVIRAQEEEIRVASMHYLFQDIMRNYVHKVLLGTRHETCDYLEDELLHFLSDLSHYFKEPEKEGLSDTEYRHEMQTLLERQVLFKRQGALQFILTVTMEISEHKNKGMVLVEKKLYKLLAAMIHRNRDNCHEFATRRWLRVFMEQLFIPAFTHSVLEVIECLLMASPEVLDIISNNDIRTIVKLLHTNGRDIKVMKLLSLLCVSQGVAMREKQRQIYKHLIGCHDLLLQTSLKDRVHSLHPTLYVGVCDGSAMHQKWYFEVEVTKIPSRTYHLRVGWAHAHHFLSRPSSNGRIITDGGIGDDVFSVGFDGLASWVGGHCIRPPSVDSSHFPQSQHSSSLSTPSPPSEDTPILSGPEDTPLSVGDVIGCYLDLTRNAIRFARNGVPADGEIVFHHCTDMLTPAISFSSGVNAVMSLGGQHGDFTHVPPAEYAPLCDAGLSTTPHGVSLIPFRCLGISNDLITTGPMILADNEAFVPAPIVTSGVSLPDQVLHSGIKDRLATNIHEVWAKNKIEAGFTYAEVRNDRLKHNPSLKPFNDLSEAERKYDYDMALDTLSTLVVLGYQISSHTQASLEELPYMELSPDMYQLSNGYIPRPMNLVDIAPPRCLMGLVDKLAENAHNIWAAGRIKEGWTYGRASNSDRKKNSSLVPYSKLDSDTKKSNEDTALESIRTIIALGCTIQPSCNNNSSNIHQLAREFAESHVLSRTFRGQTCYRLVTGKWYYEVKLLTGGIMRIGWATPSYLAGTPLGADTFSYAFDGFLACKWHSGSDSFGRRWTAGDIVGCLLDIENQTIYFTLNGELLYDHNGESSVAFDNVISTNGFIPVMSLSAGERAQFNFGQSDEALQYDHSASGYVPVCCPTALSYNLPLWYSSLGEFQTIDHTHLTLLTHQKSLTEGESDSIISLAYKDHDYSTRPKQECFRLSVGLSFPQTMSEDSPTDGGISFGRTAEELVGGKVCFSVVVPSGQDPSQVVVGWTTAEFRYMESQFKARGSIPNEFQYGQQVDVVSSSGACSKYSTAFMVSLSELLQTDDLHTPCSVTVICMIDVVSWKVMFSVSTPLEIDAPSIVVQIPVSRNSKLFPTVVINPTTEYLVDFDLNPVQGCSSLSSLLLSPFLEASVHLNHTPTPLCPPRIKVQEYRQSCWVRKSLYKANYSVDVASDGRLKFAANTEPSLSMLMNLPEEDRVIDILEISEEQTLLDFHIQTIETYCAVCSHSNLDLAAKVSQSLRSTSLLEYMKLADESMKLNLKQAYLKLFYALHLQHEVLTRLTMRGEFVIALSECTQLIPLTPLISPVKRINSHTHVSGTFLCNQMTVDQTTPPDLSPDPLSHDLSPPGPLLPDSVLSPGPTSMNNFSTSDLKEHVFRSIERLLSSRSYSVRLFPGTLSEVFVPLIKTLDYLLIIGEINLDSELQQLLRVLHPSFSDSSSKQGAFLRGLLSSEVACEEPIKSALCELLQHLCDRQIQHRIEALVTFAHGYVDELQQQQESRHKKFFIKRPREFRCPPEMQLQAMMTASQMSSPTQKRLHETVSKFHKELQEHCGSYDSHHQVPISSLSIAHKLDNIISLLKSSEEPRNHGDRITSLRDLITTTMIKWAQSNIQDYKLISDIFSLLHRQFDEIHEVADTLLRTYVIDVAKDGNTNFNILTFSRALGSLRLLLKVGMGKLEENLLKDSLSTIKKSSLFYYHPHLLRQLGVHTTVLGLIRTYLGISSGSAQENFLSRHRLHRLKMSKAGKSAPPVEDCCKFLCTFARISQENQRVLFKHIGYLLEHVEKCPDLMVSSGCTPLDIVTATIRDNHELVLRLKESQLENVVQLLVAMTTNISNHSQEVGNHHGNDLGMVHSVSFTLNFEWNPQAGGKCLEFLQCAVWVDNEQIQENAYIIVRLLIRHSECMGPALAGDALGLYTIYKEAIERSDLSLDSSMDDSSEVHSHDSFNKRFSSRQSLLRNMSRQSTISVDTVSTRSLLSFYTSLVKILACCAPEKVQHGNRTDHTSLSSNSASKQKEGCNLRTLNILRNLIKLEDIIGILSLPCTAESEDGLSPSHKTAIVWFLDRVYEITEPSVFVQLLASGFLPDLKLILKPDEMTSDQMFVTYLKRYVCCSVLPLVTQYAPIFKTFQAQLHVLVSFVSCCCQLYTCKGLSSAHLEHIAKFFMAFTRELHPKAIMRFLPKIISNLYSSELSSIVHCKFLSFHYERYARYYRSGILDRSSLGTANEMDKMSAALVVHRLIDSLIEKFPTDPVILQAKVTCIRLSSCALSPDGLVPPKDLLNSLYPVSAETYEPRPLDTSQAYLTSDLETFIDSYGSYCHDNWVYEQQNEGWVYGPIRSEDKRQHPHIRPFDLLDKSDQISLKAPIQSAVKFLLTSGTAIKMCRPFDARKIPFKLKTVCIRRPKRKESVIGNRQDQLDEVPYEPRVLDLSGEKLRVDLLVVAETMAEDSHEQWARNLKHSSPDCHTHMSFVPYVLLDEKKKEELRTNALNILRYLQVSGFEMRNTYRTMSISVSPNWVESRSSKDKFCVQLFDKFLHCLSTPSIDISFHTQVLFPTITSYLSQHAGYFMPPVGGHRGHSFASKLEKLKILQIFCRVMEYTRQNLNKLILPATKTSSSFLCPSPEDHTANVTPLDSKSTVSNWATVNCILSLTNSLFKALDIKGILENSDGLAHECPEVIDFFRQAVSGMHLTSKGLHRPDKLDVHFHFYCLHILTPTLSSLFKHLGCHGSGKYLIVDAVQNHCRYIFQNLIEMATCTGPVYVGSSPLIAIGQCMGSLSLAYPEPFLKNELFTVSLSSLLEQLHRATVEGVTCGNVLFVVDIIIPVLTNYISHWLGEHNSVDSNGVAIETVDEVSGAILLMVSGHFNMKDVTWLPRILDGALLLASKCSIEILHLHLVGLLEQLRERAISLWQDEQFFAVTWTNEASGNEGPSKEMLTHSQDYQLFARDLCTILPFLAVFLQSHASSIRSHPPTPSPVSSPTFTPSPTSTHSPAHAAAVDMSIQSIFISVADIFHCWSLSQHFKREFQTAAFTIIDNSQVSSFSYLFAGSAQPSNKLNQARSLKQKPPNFLLVCLELLLPVSDQTLSKEDRTLLKMYTEKLGMKRVVVEDLMDELIQELKLKAFQSQPMAKQLVKRVSQTLLITSPERSVTERAVKIISLARVKHKLRQIEAGHAIKNKWRQLLSQRKKKAIMKCFLAIPYFKLKKYRAINMFLQLYRTEWLIKSSEPATHDLLVEELVNHQDYLVSQRSQGRIEGEWSEQGGLKDPLSQLLSMFKRHAYTCMDVSLYIAITDILSKSVIGHSEEDDDISEDNNATKAYQLYSDYKAELVVRQGQLADRGAHSMILVVILAAEGVHSKLVHSTLKLGIALLKEGNKRVQDDMLQELRGMDVGFLSSIASLISSCSVLDWNAYERFNKSEPSQIDASDSMCKVLPDAPFTISLFRFLQLVCEGHNEAFQNYLRTQAGNTTTVNVIICTVDYLLKLQESISDFFWHYSEFPVIDLQGRENFLLAFKVAKQVMRSLTEFIQGPCLMNQEALAQSRLWDAVSGFLHVFSLLQRKLYQETSQLELLRELLGLQEEVFILLLSMLEGSAKSSSIGKLMVDMLLESSHCVQDIAQFFSIFVKLKETATSKAFREYDLNKDGFISYREFEKAMKAQQRYTVEEIAYLMECADLNKDGLLDYLEFTERFHQPAKNIGFHLCVLVVHLSDLLPADSCLTGFRYSPQIKDLMRHFENSLGCIEILGKSRKVERVYFKVHQSWLQQWEEPQIQESRRNFLHSVEMGSQKDKLKGFVSFCEDTMFEMDHVDNISGSEVTALERRASTHRRAHNTMNSQGFLSRVKAQGTSSQKEHSLLIKLLAYLYTIVLVVFRVIKSSALKTKETAAGVYAAVRCKMVPSPPAIVIGSQDKKLNRPVLLKIPKAKAKSPPARLNISHDEVANAGRRGRHSDIVPDATGVKKDYDRGFSLDSKEGSIIMTPHPSRARTILSYNQSTMKHPLSANTTPVTAPTPSNMQSTESYVPRIQLSVRSWSSVLARNYFRLNNAKLILTFFINSILLTFKVTSFDVAYSHTVSAMNTNETSYELQDPFWGPLLLNTLAFFHFSVSVVLVASYWYLKVPLIVFKREKRIVRQLESKQTWVQEDPETLEDKWDGIVVKSPSFPRNYFDKQVKKRECEQLGPDTVNERARRLGIETRSKYQPRSKFDRILEMCQSLCDVRYNVWMFGITITNMMMLYQLLYCALSFFGLHWNAFYFSIHLLDLVMNIKLLKTVLSSVLLNGKQLAMTVLMTCVIIYLYTVIAFNFFRKFYHKTSPDGLKVQTCTSMFRCFIYHIDQGLRSGGGIADVLESASGDPNEFLRLFFDITFFFIVIIILLAIIQGLIIDSFGELRDKEEMLTNEMATKCFVCGLPKNRFDHIPHGFDNHINKEHNTAHYMFFMLNLIKKRESEFTGQESYVWDKYLKQDWDFFPTGDCFNSQTNKPLSGEQQMTTPL